MICSLLAVALLALTTEARGAAMVVAVVTGQGGINPSQERLELRSDGTVTRLQSSLARKDQVPTTWTIGEAGVAKVRERLARTPLDGFPEQVNQGRGSTTPFAVTVELPKGDGIRQVTAYTMGVPAPPEELTRLVADLKALLARPPQ
jgi:hypothetical protein